MLLYMAIDITIKICHVLLHMYVYIDITIVFDILSIVYILHYAPLYSTIEASRRLIERR
jgi:hypothetical protein